MLKNLIADRPQKIRMRVQFIGRDGCYLLHGTRVRAAPGNGRGSIYDEFERGITTPLAGEKERKTCLDLVGSADLKQFIGTLTLAKLIVHQ